MITEKDQKRFIKEMRMDMFRAKHLRHKANVLRIVALVGMKSIVFMGEKLNWINDQEPVKNPIGREYLKMIFAFGSKADFARRDYNGFMDSLIAELKAFNNKVHKQNEGLLSNAK